MDETRVPQPTVIDLTDAGLARVTHGCGLCGCADDLYRLVTSPCAFCATCFAAVYARD